MQKIWLLVQDQSVFVYVIAGLCVCGVLSKMLLQGKLHRLIKASENMALTKERQMRTIRNHYENNLNMDIQINHIGAFVEKYIAKLKYGGIPIRIWDALTLEMTMLSVAVGGLGIINAMYRGYDETVVVEILVATIMASAILLSCENIFRLENAYDQLAANIEDYLDNNLRSRLGRPIISRQERVKKTQKELVAVASEITGMKDYHNQTDTGGRVITRPYNMTGQSCNQEVELPDEVPEYEIRRKATKNYAKELSTPSSNTSHEEEIAEGCIAEAAAGEEENSEYDAALVAEVLRSFFSG